MESTSNTATRKLCLGCKNAQVCILPNGGKHSPVLLTRHVECRHIIVVCHRKRGKRRERLGKRESLGERSRSRERQEKREVGKEGEFGRERGTHRHPHRHPHRHTDTDTYLCNPNKRANEVCVGFGKTAQRLKGFL